MAQNSLIRMEAPYLSHCNRFWNIGTMKTLIVKMADLFVYVRCLFLILVVHLKLCKFQCFDKICGNIFFFVIISLLFQTKTYLSERKQTVSRQSKIAIPPWLIKCYWIMIVLNENLGIILAKIWFSRALIQILTLDFTLN